MQKKGDPVPSIFISSVIYQVHWSWCPLSCINSSGPLANFVSDNRSSPVWHQAITWINAYLLSIGTLGTNWTEAWIQIKNFSVKENIWQFRPLCPGVNELTHLSLANLNEILGTNFPDNFSDWWLIISCEPALRWVSLDLTDDKSTLVQIMAWCRQSGNKPLPEPMLTQIFVAIWRD